MIRKNAISAVCFVMDSTQFTHMNYNTRSSISSLGNLLYSKMRESLCQVNMEEKGSGVSEEVVSRRELVFVEETANMLRICKLVAHITNRN